MLRSRSALPHAIILSALLVGCSDNGREPIFSEIQPVTIPPADTTTRTNINITNPTLTVPTTFEVSDGGVLTLVWSDEFDGPQLDPEVWFFESGDGSQYGIPGWGNNEQQWYLPDNARLENGRLIITAKRETVGEFGYTSARITTQDRLAVQYGRIEARMKLPAGQGLWPAFWMLPQDDEQGSPPAEGVYGGFSASGEIDIMEAVNLGGNPGPGGLGGGNEIFGTIHFGGEFPDNQFSTIEYTVPESLTEQFNTFAVEWDEFEIRWYVNGVLFAAQNSWFSDGAPYPAPFDQPFKILLNLAVGGNLPGAPDGTTPAPATMEVDWVRIYSGEAPGGGMPVEPTTSAPMPSEAPADVISVFSDAYTSIAANVNPSLGQATVFSAAQLAGDEFLKYAGLDFQVIDFSANPQDVSDKGYLHVDVWTADSTALDIFLVSPDPAPVTSPSRGSANSPSAGSTEASYSIPVAMNSWVSVDIPLTAFAGVDLTNVIQFRFEGNGTIFVDNLYFAGEPPDPALKTPPPDDIIYATDPTETIDLNATPTIFGTSTAFDLAYALDADFNPAIQAISGSGYGLDHIVQLGFVGLPAGFAENYASFAFKIKSGDLPGNSIEVKLEGGGSCGVIDLADTNFSTPLGNGWFEVLIPVSSCPGADVAVGVLFERVGPSTADGGSAFSFLATDIGFNDASALPGIVPGDVIFSSDPGEMVDLNTTPTIFGTSTAFDLAYALDADFSPAIQVISGSGYGLDHIAQLGFVGLPAGFASGYESFAFKIKSSDLPGNAIEVKLEGGGSCGVIDLTDTNFSTPLGNDWFQVVVPMSNCQGVATAVGVLFERVGPSTADGGTAFSFLATDIGFINASALDGTIPDDVIYATNPGETVDLAATTTIFGTSTAFDLAYTLDADFNPSIQVTSGSGYGLDHIAQLGFIGLPAGFASAYESFSFKIKSSDLPGNAIEVKLEGGGSCGVIDLANMNLSSPLGNGWFQVDVPLSSCAGVATAVGVLFERVGPATADGGTAFSFLLTDIGFNNADTTGGGGTELAVNGDFETGDFTGWQQAVNSGTQAISSDTPADGGAWSAALSANTAPGQGGTTEIKQANLGAGTLALGDELTITFDVKGTFGPAGQLNVLSFTEFAGGGGNLVDNTIITGGVDDWTTQTINVTLSGADAGGGFSLAFNPVCGAVAGCVADVLIDNVSIVFNDGTGGGGGGATGTVPDDVIYATDPGEMVDLAATPTIFGTSTTFDLAYALDADFNPAVQAISGSGYGLDHIVQLGFIGLPAGFASGYESFSFKMKSSDLPGNAIEVKFEGGGTCGVINLADTGFSTPLGNDWFQVVIPLSGCGAFDSAVGVLFERVGPQTADGGTAFSFLATDIGFNNPTGGGGGGGTELAVNGDFETGDFTGWIQAVNSGVQSISNDVPADGGSFSAALSANTAPGQGGTTEIKQANLGAGTLALGDVLTVTFDVKGTFGPAGQLNVLSFTEFAGGGGTLSNNTIISGGVDDWTTRTITVTLDGPDAGGGYSLAFNPVCGAVTDCVADVLIDNVSVVRN